MLHPLRRFPLPTSTPAYQHTDRQEGGEPARQARPTMDDDAKHALGLGPKEQHRKDGCFGHPIPSSPCRRVGQTDTVEQELALEAGSMSPFRLESEGDDHQDLLVMRPALTSVSPVSPAGPHSRSLFSHRAGHALDDGVPPDVPMGAARARIKRVSRLDPAWLAGGHK